jgi:aryl-alcohol dehydrogenase-like predicted oxidoreductase
MKQVDLGRTGVHVSRIGFGGMPLSIQGRPDEAQARKTIHAALDAGINFIDTADVYCLDDSDIGHNERLIASVLRERSDASAVHVATKGGLRRPKGEWTVDASPKHLREACEASLRALGTDRIFLYQLHAPDPKVPFTDSVGELARLRKEGKIEHVGLSNVSPDELAQAQSVVTIVSVQNRLNPYFRESLASRIIEQCELSDITFLAYSPLGGKRLSRKIPRFEILERIARRRGVTPEVVTLAWCMAKGSVVVPIPGASSPEHAIDSATAAAVVLTPEEVSQIDGAEFSRA